MMKTMAAATRRQRRHAGCRRHAGGSSLVELMIAITIGLLVLTALAALFAHNSQARAEIDQATQQIENGRYALELLREDIHLAGYYGPYAMSGATPVEVSPCQTALASMGWSTATSTVPVWISGFRHGDTLPAGCALPHLKAGTDGLVIRRLNTTPVTVATAGTPANQTSFHLQVSACPGDAMPYVFAPGGAGAAAFTLRQKDCATIAALRKFEVHAWYIGTCSVCTGAADTIPTLRRLELAGGALSDLPLVEGIEAMRVDYALDADGDGHPESSRRCTSDAASASHCPAATLANTMGLRVYLLARNLKTTINHTDNKTYSMGISGSLTPGGSYRRHAYSALVAVVNASGRREQ